MANKLDMGKAWNEALALIMANRETVLIVAGVFFLLPSLASSLLIAPPAGLEAIEQGAQPDPDVIIGALGAWFASNWWVFLLTGIAQTIGVLGLLTLLTDRARPTVGEALSAGVRALPTYIGTQLITAAGFALVIILIGLMGALWLPLGLIAGLALAVGMIYVGVKLMLVTPVIAIEKQRSPMAALARSWRLTKSNSLLIVAFVLLLLLAFLVISAVIGLALGLFAFAGEQVGVIAGAIGNAVLGMALVVVMTAVVAAIYRQLSGTGGADVSGTFG